MRCSLCDATDNEAGSIYHFSVVDTKRDGRKRYIYYSKERDMEICNVCEEAIKKTTRESKLEYEYNQKEES